MTIQEGLIQLGFQSQSTGRLVMEVSFWKTNQQQFNLIPGTGAYFDEFLTYFKALAKRHTLNFDRNQNRHRLYYFAPFQMVHRQNLNRTYHFYSEMFLIYLNLNSNRERKTQCLTEKTFSVQASWLHPRYLLEIQQESKTFRFKG